MFSITSINSSMNKIPAPIVLIPVSATGLSTYYTFDTGTIVSNNVPNIASGTAVNDAIAVAVGGNYPTISTSSYVVGNGSLDFNVTSTSSYGYIKKNTFTPTTGGLTFVCWLNFSNYNNTSTRLFDFANGAPNGNIFYAPYVGFGIFDGATERIYVGGPSFSAAVMKQDGTDNNKWIHFAWTLTYAASTSNTSTTKIYKNILGSSFNSTPFYTNNACYYPTTSATRTLNYIGMSNWGGASDRPVDGNIDDFRIYDRVLSAEEIQSLFYNRTSVRAIP